MMTYHHAHAIETTPLCASPLTCLRAFPLAHSLASPLTCTHHPPTTNTQGIGLPLEEAMRFWRTEFAPRVPGDKFDKEYAYNVRHSYGKEGKKANYTPWGCLKIVQMTPNQVQYG